MKKFIIGAVAVVVLLLAGFGIAQASIPAPDGTINGCYKNSTGDLKVVDSTASCPGGYTALNWPSAGVSARLETFSTTMNGLRQDSIVSCDPNEYAVGAPAVWWTTGQGAITSSDVIFQLMPNVNGAGFVESYRAQYIGTDGEIIHVDVTCLEGVSPS